MELKMKLKGHEVEDILLAWAEAQFPGRFNDLAFEASYNSVRSVEFSFDEDAVPVETAGSLSVSGDISWQTTGVTAAGALR